MSSLDFEPRTALPRVSIKAIRDMGERHEAASTINVGQVERWASAVAGGLLVAHGLRRGNFGGLGLAVLGGALAYRGFTGHCQAYQALNIDTSGKHRSDAEEDVHKGRLAKQTVTINRSAGEIYDFLQQPANHLKFSEGVESVSKSDDGTWHWAIKGPLGSTWKFDSKRINEEPGHLIAWKSLPGGDIDNAGSYRLVPAFGGSGTEVTLEVNYEMPAGAVGLAASKILGHDPNARVREDLRRLKNLLEAGEIPTVEGQTSGRASS